MELGAHNQQYWRQYKAGTTPGVDSMPPVSLLKSLPVGAHVLDVGTGTGRLAEALSAKRGFKVFGIDINSHEVEANDSRDSGVEYSVQDIAKTTSFPDAYFDLLLFRYTLTNIHKDQWSGFSAEVDRITKPGSLIWLAEPHINDAYQERYALGGQSLGDNHTVYVFNDKKLTASIKDMDSLEEAIKQDKVIRIVRHYDEPELFALFPDFKQVSLEHINDTSPSGYPLDTVVMVLQKAS